MTNSEQLPAAWESALERFRGGLGCEFDPSDPTDIACFMPLLEEAVYEKISREMVRSFREATSKAREQLDVLRRGQSQ